MAPEVGHPSCVDSTPEQDPPPVPAADLITQALDNAELRPSLLADHADETKRAHRKRLAHYQQWCAANGFQSGLEHISEPVVEAYIRAQCVARELRPNTLRQALYALAAASERVSGRAVSISVAREMIKLSEEMVPVEPAYRVTREVRRPRATRRYRPAAE